MSPQGSCRYSTSQGLSSDPLLGDSDLLKDHPPHHPRGQLHNNIGAVASTGSQLFVPSTRQTTTALHSPSDLTTAHQPSSRKRSAQQVASDDPMKPPATAEEIAAEKRRRNTLAARRFRQKQQDRIAQLEQALKEVTKERDDLKMQVARWEGEAVALRAMLAERSKDR
ncbi:hypothetical protein VTO42DRAFT_6003 [Malbranchea cinnamomea]